LRFVLFTLYSAVGFCRIAANNRGKLKMKKTNLVLASIVLAVLSRGAFAAVSARLGDARERAEG